MCIQRFSLSVGVDECRRKYSEQEQKKTQTFGEKVFYYRAARLIGDVDLPPSVGKDFNWVSLKEIPEYIKDENLIGYLNRVLEWIVCVTKREGLRCLFFLLFFKALSKLLLGKERKRFIFLHATLNAALFGGIKSHAS